MTNNWKLVEPHNFEAIESQIKANLDSAQKVEVSSDFYGQLTIAIDSLIVFTAQSISPLTWRVPLNALLESAKTDLAKAKSLLAQAELEILKIDLAKGMA